MTHPGGRAKEQKAPDADVSPPERPTHPPPPTYPMLRDSTAVPAAYEVPLDDALEEAIPVEEQPPEVDESSADMRVAERVLTEREMEWLALGEDHLALLGALDGVRSLASAAALVGIDIERARALLDRLLRRGVVRLVP